jgi:hypothetical protein
MTTQTIALFAIGVFVLMCIGIIMTMIEFNRLTEEPSERKGAGDGQAPKQAPVARGKAEMRIVHSNENAA